jgi:hypothetical protein
MKKTTIKPSYLVLIAAASFCAFIFLNTVKVKNKNSVGVKYEQPKLNNKVEEDEKSVEHKTPAIALPGIESVKNILVLVKKFIPAS